MRIVPFLSYRLGTSLLISAIGLGASSSSAQQIGAARVGMVSMPAAATQQIDSVADHPGSRSSHVVIGSVAGAVIGGLLGGLSARSSKNTDTALDGIAAAASVAIGAIVGTIVGGVIGAFLPHS